MSTTTTNTNYTKAMLVDDLAGLDLIFKSKKAAKDALEFIIDKIKTQVKAGNQVDISGLASFKPAVQAAKHGTVPGTKTLYSTPEKRTIKIRPAKPFKDMVNE